MSNIKKSSCFCYCCSLTNYFYLHPKGAHCKAESASVLHEHFSVFFEPTTEYRIPIIIVKVSSLAIAIFFNPVTVECFVCHIGWGLIYISLLTL